MAEATQASITTDVETITPALAREYLEVNYKNRKLTNKVHRFANAMVRGDWRLNGEAIKFDYNGQLIDGQHRMWALLEAAETDSTVTFETLVVRGLPPDTQLTMDQGAPRKFSDALAWKDEKDVARLASSIRVLNNFLRTGVISTQQHAGSVTNEELFETLDKHPYLRECMGVPQNARNSKLLTKSVASVLYYLFSRVSPEDATGFFHLLGGGEGESGVTITYLRNKLQDNATRTHAKLDTRHLSAFTIKAFNSYCSGSELKQLRWSGGGARPEPYPRIEGLDIGPYT